MTHCVILCYFGLGFMEMIPYYEPSCKVAVDLLAEPASQAFVERLFSVCGMLSHGRQNRMKKSLEMRVWLKVNFNVLHEIE